MTDNPAQPNTPESDAELRIGLQLIFFPSPIPTILHQEAQGQIDKAMSLIQTAIDGAVEQARLDERKELKRLFDALGMRFGASAGSATGVTVRNSFGEEFDFQLDRDALRELLGRFNNRLIPPPVEHKAEETS